MATYNPSQPMWKRNVAGILDFLLAVVVLGYPLGRLFPAAPHPVPHIPGATTTTELFSLSGSAALLLIALLVAYFVVLGRTGGTVFQRLFRMKRARRAAVAA